MKGDNSRFTFHPGRRFAAVRMQQGRVALDADWNEQVEIADRLRRVPQTDVTGVVGAPWDEPRDEATPVDRRFRSDTDEASEFGAQHFAISPRMPDCADLLVAPGRMLVRGLLCENPDGCTLDGQPDFRPLSIPKRDIGTYLIWLDVRTHHVSSAEDNSLVEPALGGPDTATRSRVVWQVRAEPLHDIPDLGWGVTEYGALWAAARDWERVRGAVEHPTGTLEAGLEPSDDTANPCLLPADAGYRRLQNQLYRVEIHRPGGRTASDDLVPPQEVATFKWNRDNGSDAYRIASISSSTGGSFTLTLETEPRDEERGFHSLETVEVFDDRHLYGDDRAQLFRVTSAAGAEVVLEGTSPFGTTELVHAQIRKWHPSSGEGALLEGLPIDGGDEEGWIALEDGVRIHFGEGTYEAGDYWTIPARSLTGQLAWPPAGAKEVKVSPDGVERGHAMLGFATWNGKQWSVLQDLRPRFPALADAWTLHWIGDPAPKTGADTGSFDLAARVLCGGEPVRGAPVSFWVDDDNNGTIAAYNEDLIAHFPPDDDVSGKSWVFVYTNVNGAARCTWKPRNPDDRVKARLYRQDGTQTQQTVTWVHQVSGHVDSTPKPPVKGAQIVGVDATWYVGEKKAKKPFGQRLALNDTLSVRNVTGMSLTVQTNESVVLPKLSWKVGPDPRVNVTLYVPELGLTKLGITSFRPVILSGVVSVTDGGKLTWTLNNGASLGTLLDHFDATRLRAVLTIHCDHVLAGKDKDLRNLAGGPFREAVLPEIEALPARETARRSRKVGPLTDGPPGGTFRFWFRIAKDAGVKGKPVLSDTHGVLRAMAAADREVDESRMAEPEPDPSVVG